MISNISNKTSAEISEQLNTVFENTREEVSKLADQAPENIVESVHLIRKRLKFLRAFIKLTQFCSDGDTYKGINGILRDSGKLISDCRDAHVRALLLEEFRQTKTKASWSTLIKKLTDANANEIKKIEKELLSGRSAFDELISNLSKASVSNYFRSLEPDTESIFSGYGRCYQKSYDAFHSELVSHEAELLHEWRKRTKDLQYQQEVLVESIPAELPPNLAEVSELCETLGRINDLFMFSDWISSSNSQFSSVGTVTSFLEEIQQELKMMENGADERGHSLYRFSPAEYIDKLQQAVHV